MATSFASKRITIDDPIEAMWDLAAKSKWGDGLPLVPPTEERVNAMIAAGGRGPGELVATIAPRYAEATVEKVAINAVMAGCHPSYFPAVLAAVEAMGSDRLLGLDTTTSPVCLFTVINGPMRQRINLNGSYGCLGPGWRANATIGRAIRLIQFHIGGAWPGSVSKSDHGQPGRYTMCIGEFEEKNPWEPLHVERGFAKEDSTVTVLSVGGTTDVLSYNPGDDPEDGLLLTIALAVKGIEHSHAPIGEAGGFLLLLPPGSAKHLHDRGYTKQRIKDIIYEKVKAVPLSEWPVHEQKKIQGEGRALSGTINLVRSPDAINIVVAGGGGSYHQVVMPGGAGGITKKINVP